MHVRVCSRVVSCWKRTLKIAAWPIAPAATKVATNQSSCTGANFFKLVHYGAWLGVHTAVRLGVHTAARLGVHTAARLGVHTAARLGVHTAVWYFYLLL
jgi:hypothetical protein